MKETVSLTLQKMFYAVVDKSHYKKKDINFGVCIMYIQGCNTLHATYLHYIVHIISFIIAILQKRCHKLLIMETGQVHAKFQNALVMQCTNKNTFACMCTHYFSEDCNKRDYRVVKVSHARQ